MAKFTTDSKFLSHSDISDAEDTIVTIKSYDREAIGQGAQATEKWVLYFKELKKGLGLNKTNGKLLCSILDSEDMDDWIGQKIALYVKDDVEYQGEIVSAIRVRSKLPGKMAPKPEIHPQPISREEIIYAVDHAGSNQELNILLAKALMSGMSSDDLQSVQAAITQRTGELKVA